MQDSAGEEPPGKSFDKLEKLCAKDEESLKFPNECFVLFYLEREPNLPL